MPENTNKSNRKTMVADSEKTEKQVDTPRTAAEEKIIGVPKPKEWYVKKDYSSGVNINNQIIQLWAGQPIKDLYLLHMLQKGGIEMVNSLSEVIIATPY